MMSALITPDIAKKDSLGFLLVKQSSTIQPWKVDLGPNFWIVFHKILAEVLLYNVF